MSKNKIIKGRPAWGPVVEGYAFVCPNSIVGWNGADVKTGIVTEKGNVHYGDSFAGKIIVMPCSRGSLGWSDMFRNSEYNGVGPIGYVFTTMDSKCGTAIFNTRRPCVADFPANCDPCKEIHDGDHITIDVDQRSLQLDVPQEEIDRRLAAWKRPEPKFKKGWLGLYCKLAASGSEGGVMKFDHL